MGFTVDQAVTGSSDMNGIFGVVLLVFVVIVAAIVYFAVIKPMMKRKAQGLPRPSASVGVPAPIARTRLCPFCAEEINAQAIKCKHCGSTIVVGRESMPTE